MDMLRGTARAVGWKGEKPLREDRAAGGPEARPAVGWKPLWGREAATPSVPCPLTAWNHRPHQISRRTSGGAPHMSARKRGGEKVSTPKRIPPPARPDLARRAHRTAAGHP